MSIIKFNDILIAVQNPFAYPFQAVVRETITVSLFGRKHNINKNSMVYIFYWFVKLDILCGLLMFGRDMKKNYLHISISLYVLGGVVL